MHVPNRTWFDPVLDSRMHTGDNAIDIAERRINAGVGYRIAIDIETPGLHDQFTIRCVTASWHGEHGIESVLLDPQRNPIHHSICAQLIDAAGEINLHNACFDTPGLYRERLISYDAIKRIRDTLLVARAAWPDSMIRKNLESLAVKHLGMADLSGGMALAFKARGFKTIADGYAGMDIDSPIYRMGAMADTAATYALMPVLVDCAVDHLLDHPFNDHGATTRDEALRVLDNQHRVNGVMLQRSAVGLAVDLAYLDEFAERTEDEKQRSIATLAQAGLEAGVGKAPKLIQHLDALGELPDGWPRTPKGALRATKADLEALDHPLAVAQRNVAHTDKVIGYLEKVANQAERSGRCHPQVQVLGASATGRMSYAWPELQQFPAEARAIITDDGQGLTSIDWSQIEPVTMANLAGDAAFLEPFEQGEDLYEPIMRAAGIPRKIAKVVLLATMYGQGIGGLSRTIGHSEDSATQIKRQMLSAMPACARWMGQVAAVADQYERVVTIGGRILTVPAFNGQVASYKAVNYMVQGSAYDIMAASIIEMDRRGIAQHLQLAMHDELVVDTEVAAEVQEIMLTPPPELIKWSGRTPVLRTDSADMQHHWASV